MQTVSPTRRIAVAVALCAIAAFTPGVVRTSTAATIAEALPAGPIVTVPHGRSCGMCWEAPVT